MINEEIIDEWNMLFHSEDENIDTKLKNILRRYADNTEEGISKLINPFKIMLEKNAVSDVRRLTYGDNWLLKLPSAVRQEHHITKDGEMERLKGQKGIFRHLVFDVHAIDDIKKAYIKEYNRMYKNDEEIYDYFVDKIFLKAYNAQLKRTDDRDGVFAKIMNSVRQDNVEELLREIEEREKNRRNEGKGGIQGYDDGER